MKIPHLADPGPRFMKLWDGVEILVVPDAFRCHVSENIRH